MIKATRILSSYTDNTKLTQRTWLSDRLTVNKPINTSIFLYILHEANKIIHRKYREAETHTARKLFNHSSSCRDSSASRHSRAKAASRFTPAIRSAYNDSHGVLLYVSEFRSIHNWNLPYLNVIPLWEDMTPIACNTAFLESLENTAGWLIHSKADSNSESRADTVSVSILVAGVKFPSRGGVIVGCPGCDSPSVLSVSGDAVEGGRGGSAPFPKPRRMVLVSFKRVCARSCWLLETSVNDRVSISEVKSSIRRWTTIGCGGIGGDPGRPVLFLGLVAGNIVIVSKCDRDCESVPSR